LWIHIGEVTVAFYFICRIFRSIHLGLNSFSLLNGQFGKNNDLFQSSWDFFLLCVLKEASTCGRRNRVKEKKSLPLKSRNMDFYYLSRTKPQTNCYSKMKA